MSGICCFIMIIKYPLEFLLLSVENVERQFCATNLKEGVGPYIENYIKIIQLNQR